MSRDMIGIIFGTRPEIIKFSSIIKECEKQNVNFFIIHTGQHYSYCMDKIFLKELQLPEVNFHLEIGSAPHGEQIGKMLIGIEKVLKTNFPSCMIVLGDPNSALAGALVAKKMHIPVCHIEAGRRSYNKNMQEEINRIIIDHISDLLFTPTLLTKKNLMREGINKDNVILTGDPIVSVIKSNMIKAEDNSKILEIYNLFIKDYILVTIHREENVENNERLVNIIFAIQYLSEKLSRKIIFPMHPRTRKKIQELNISLKKIIITEPLGYFDFLKLESNASLVVTDSGSIQEEACILKVPCVTLRDETERPETLIVGSNVLVGTCPDKILKESSKMLSIKPIWENPFGDENCARNIVQLISNKYLIR
jgi:UDP-N-acetylglucosamine 2-epimerase (non-hydrolysing)